jgi:hypothetical protein
MAFAILEVVSLHDIGRLARLTKSIIPGVDVHLLEMLVGEQCNNLENLVGLVHAGVRECVAGVPVTLNFICDEA